MKTETQNLQHDAKMARRAFLRYAGAGVAVAGLATVQSCSSRTEYDNEDMSGGGSSDKTDVGSGDVGILNFAYALEQLEAAFYVKVADSWYSGITDMEKMYLSDIRDHEVSHREFFKKALAGNAIKGLTPNFSSIDFSSRASVLATAKAFEDLGVTAYDGAGYMLKSADYLTVAGKIASVEARHAAVIAELLEPGSFVTNAQVNASGLNIVRTPKEVVSIANAFLTTKISAKNL
ncbi:ferritin-like domain-containing protein [Mucilaginibacter limnophilus]|uniref:Ferritin-like domain-containing protein n=1 Tax=Mucilaginibacter limnophilus TaxID=1932778 RepID=A0A437MSH3_9SPHI|nr:ferritin-like domain-containing protein [Mucilaginibacter limnophilus]RVU00548.1 ferritin-like domain-containing protein [Mucilaginibacter limnophilus]